MWGWYAWKDDTVEREDDTHGLGDCTFGWGCFTHNSSFTDSNTVNESQETKYTYPKLVSLSKSILLIQ